MRILLDNGHGTYSKQGSPDGRIKEYVYARELVKIIAEKLRALNYDVDIITPEEADISLATRVNRANAICKKYGKNNCLFISVHCNASGADGKWHSASGWTEWIYTKASENSKKLAQCLYAQAEKYGLQGNRSVPSCKYWTANYYVCRYTNCPAVLTENLFQDNKDDVEYMLTKEGKETLANIHVNGILAYLKK